MNPHVRETVPTPAAVPLTPSQKGLANAVDVPQPVVAIEVPASNHQEAKGKSILDKRRRRHARLSNRH